MPPKSTQGKPKYSDGEKILCFHGPLLYEAKCLGVEVKDGQIKYFVHYQGWNKNWDEWVGDARIMKFNAVGLQKQKELKEFYSKPGKKVKSLRKSDLLNQEYPPPEALRRLEGSEDGPGPATASPAQQPQGSPAPPPPPPTPPTQSAATSATPLSPAAEAAPPTSMSSAKRAARESMSGEDLIAAGTGTSSAEAPVVGGAGVGGKRLRIQIELPRQLKLWLADDAELVGRQRRLHNLPPPAGQTVSGILGRFVTAQASSGGGRGGSDELERERLSEFVAGVQSYFNAVLSTQLLYSSERQQYSALLKSHRGGMPASLYGCLHLLRLFVRLGDLLSQTKLDLKCLGSLLDYCDTFLLFVERNMDNFASTAGYEPPAESSRQSVA